MAKGFANVDKATRGGFLGVDGSYSVGAARQCGNRPTTVNSDRDPIVEPDIWSGFNLLRGGQTQGIIGSCQLVAERLDALCNLALTL